MSVNPVRFRGIDVSSASEKAGGSFTRWIRSGGQKAINEVEISGTLNNHVKPDLTDFYDVGVVGENGALKITATKDTIRLNGMKLTQLERRHPGIVDALYNLLNQMRYPVTEPQRVFIRNILEDIFGC